MLSPVRPSVCCLSVCRLKRSCTLLSRLKLSAPFLRHLVPWPSADIHRKFYGDRPRRIPPSGAQTRGVAKYSELGPIEGYLGNGARSEVIKLLLISHYNRKSYMSFRLVPKSVTLNDVEQHNGPYYGRPM